MTHDIITAAISGANRGLPFVVKRDHDTAEFRRLLSIDPEKPETFMPLVMNLSACGFSTHGIIPPLIPPGDTPQASITIGGETCIPLWSSQKPPSFLFVASTLPVATEWSLTKLDSARATLTNDAGYVAAVSATAEGGALRVFWPPSTGFIGDLEVNQLLWDAFSPVVMKIPPTGYPFAAADAKLTGVREITSLLQSSDLVTVHASILRPEERMAAVTSAVVRRYIRGLIQATDGMDRMMSLYPDYAAMFLMLDGALLKFNGSLLIL